jgi:drug/metabolite transporter (DMT)-like permease
MPPRRAGLAAVGLGAVGYNVQAGAFFGALRHIDASLTALLHYVYPVLVFGGAVILGRDRATRARIAALALAVAGVALVLLGGASGSLNAPGVALALGAALSYTVYILLADRVVSEGDPFTLAAIVTTSACAGILAFSAVTGTVDLSLDAAGWAAMVALALVSTVAGVTAFLLGLARVGPSTASIVSTVEPVVTVALAAVVFAERLGPIQLAGGALVLAAVIVLQLRPGRPAVIVAPDHATPAVAGGRE